MKYIITREEKDIKGNPRIRYCCPGCAGTIGVSPVGIRLKLGGICKNCGTELIVNPEEMPEKQPDAEAGEMTLNEYQQLAARTINPDLSEDQTEMHALHGLAAEVGEIHGLYQKAYQGHEISREDFVKEIGDVLWMLAELCTVHGYSLSDVAQGNIDKLKKRYPDGFDPERSIRRKEAE